MCFGYLSESSEQCLNRSFRSMVRPTCQYGVEMPTSATNNMVGSGWSSCFYTLESGAFGVSKWVYNRYYKQLQCLQYYLSMLSIVSLRSLQTRKFEVGILVMMLTTISGVTIIKIPFYQHRMRTNVFQLWQRAKSSRPWAPARDPGRLRQLP